MTTHEWTPAAARERLAALQRQCDEGPHLPETYLLRWADEHGTADLRHALDRIAELEALLGERERTVAEQGALLLALETECNQQSAEIARLRHEVATVRCSHAGIGIPLCDICDPRERLAQEKTRAVLHVTGRLRPLPYPLDESELAEEE